MAVGWAVGWAVGKSSCSRCRRDLAVGECCSRGLLVGGEADLFDEGVGKVLFV